MPRVSVLLNCYNQSLYVGEAIESVLNQTFKDFELIVTDNGSTDDTAKILHQYDHDPRVHIIIREKNGNVSRSFNEMVNMAQGEFVSLLLSDDYYLPEKLERQIAIFDGLDKDCDIVYGPNLVYFEATGKSILPPVINIDQNNSLIDLLENHEKGPINLIRPLIRRECYLNHPFLETLFFEGESIFLRMALRYKFHYDPNPTCVMRDTGKNWSKAFKKNLKMIFSALDALESDPAFNSAVHGAPLKTYKSSLLRNCAWCNLRLNGPVGWSYSKYFEALELAPRQLFHKRTLLGFMMALLPSKLRTRLNRFVNKKQGLPENSEVMENYEGEIPG